jgi:GNAT superfamily N-acetyltransferase
VSGASARRRVVAVGVQEGRALRMEVLRPWQSPSEAMYAREGDASTAHYAVLGQDGEVLAVGSVMADPHPLAPREGDWRVRGMATREDLRGEGLGSMVLGALEDHAREAGGRRVWCNARTAARPFYERAGFAVEGEEFQIEGIGGHFLMSKPLL